MPKPHPIAVVTGATGGLGQPIAAALYRAGYHVWGLGRNPVKTALLSEAFTAWQAERGVAAPPWRVLAHRLESPGQSARAATQILAAGGCQLVVVAHGAAPLIRPALEVPSPDFAHLLAVDLLGPFALLQRLVPQMQARRTGCIVWVSSLHALQTYPQRSPYAAVKAAVAGMVRGLAVEWGADNIRVNAILPWQVDNARTHRIASEQQAATGQDVLALMRGRSPLGRLVDAADVARTVLWLAETPSVTGQSLVVDCGVSASMWYDAFPGSDRRGP